MSAKQAINDKLQGNVATYLRRGGVVNNQIKKGLLLSRSVKYCFLIGKYWAKLQARTRLSRALSSSFSSVLARRAKDTGDSTMAPFVNHNVYFLYYCYVSGCESWTLKKNEETHLDAFEMKGLRRMLRV